MISEIMPQWEGDASLFCSPRQRGGYFRTAAGLRVLSGAIAAWLALAPGPCMMPARGDEAFQTQGPDSQVADTGGFETAEIAAEEVEEGLAKPFTALAEALEASGRQEAAEAVRRWVPAVRDDQRVAYFALPRMDTPAPSLDEPPVAAAFAKARRQVSRQAMSAAEQAAARGDAERALGLVWRAAREDPTAEPPRRILNLPAGSRSPIAVRIGRTAPKSLAWPPRSFIVVQSPHFRIFSTAPRRQATALAEDLERYYHVWSQVFRELWVADDDVCRAISAGSPLPAPEQTVDVVLFADREAYAKAMTGSVAAAKLSTGFYSPETRVTLLFAGPTADRETRYHEITHQLLQETCGEVVEAPGLEAGFWIVEGIASYMESVRFFDSLASVGGWESPRLQYARARWLGEEPPPSLHSLAVEGREAVQRRDDLGAWYSTTAAYAHLLCDSPRTRPLLMRYLRSVYRGRADLETLEEMLALLPVGETAAGTWDARLVDFLRLSDESAPPLRAGTSLRVLCLGKTRLSAEWVAALPPQEELTWLDLGYLPASDADVERIIGAGDRLVRLNLESTRVSDAVAETLVPQKGLRELDLSFTAVGDAGLEPLRGARHIEVLWLTGSEISDASLPLLRSLRSLRSLDVQRTKISAEALEQLSAARPDLQINPLQLIPSSETPASQ